nr:hypothetical protein [Pararhodonellum marinum]
MGSSADMEKRLEKHNLPYKGYTARKLHGNWFTVKHLNPKRKRLKGKSFSKGRRTNSF